MKNKKTILTFVLITAMAVSAYAQQYDSEKDFKIDWDPNIKDKIMITDYLGTKREVSIPPTIQNIPVISIGPGAFSSKNITKVIIPNGVGLIYPEAFFDCRSLSSVTIPDSVVNISGFKYCVSLASITIPNSVRNIWEYAFFGCTKLTSVIIPDGVKSIGKDAFAYCNSLTSITIGNGVTSIDGGAFYGCRNLTTITIPDSVITIADAVFYGNVPRGTFGECTSLTSVTIGNGVTKIGSNAFEGCTSLTSVTIGSGVKNIGNRAFKNCDSLTSVTFQGRIVASGFKDKYGQNNNPFPAGLDKTYLASDGGPGTYWTLPQ
jgi:hypothetical protein